MASRKLRSLTRRHGVYATPRPLVGYLVRSVHRLLQTRLGWSGGLADPAVRLLDPAAGAMNFLLAAWRLALAAHWHRGGEPEEITREHLLPHFRGIELLPAMHARGLANLRRFLAACGHPPAPGEALPGYLADALVPAGELRDFPANVVLGNPPWGGGSDHPGAWINPLLDDYFRVDGEPLGERNSKWLRDDAVKFLRLAQWKIEQAGEGVAALVLPHNGLDAPTFKGLRAALLRAFDEVYALDLHGNRRKGERGPDGESDENVFAEVAQGVALFLLVKRHGLPKRMLRADLYGSRREKLAVLAGTHVGTTRWQVIQPSPPSYLFVYGDDQREREYRRGLSLPEIFPVFSTGVITGRDALAVSLDRRSAAGCKLGPAGCSSRRKPPPSAGSRPPSPSPWKFRRRSRRPGPSEERAIRPQDGPSPLFLYSMAAAAARAAASEGAARTSMIWVTLAVSAERMTL